MAFFSSELQSDLNSLHATVTPQQQPEPHTATRQDTIELNELS
ncbi:hypothetical protein WN51_10022 [Melipona quadrifasciata]|uniref:Uncharacterized protein n=1 Tax=Melipona quadrifasciata TaxID=166423 RepID=A0A0M9ABE7_9HYME|nr:hypothetical protein WN51_10022 [Melipona quadrifasciata]